MAHKTTAEYLIRKLSLLLAEVRENVKTPDQFLTAIVNVIEHEEFDEDYFPSVEDTHELLVSNFLEATLMLTNALSAVSGEKFGEFLRKFADLFEHCGSYETTYKCVQKHSEAFGFVLQKLLNTKEYAGHAVSICHSIAATKHDDPVFGEAWRDKYLATYALNEAIERIFHNVDQFWDSETQENAKFFQWGYE